MFQVAEAAGRRRLPRARAGGGAQPARERPALLRGAGDPDRLERADGTRAGLLTQGVPGVPQDPFADPVDDPLDPLQIGNAP